MLRPKADWVVISHCKKPLGSRMVTHVVAENHDGEKVELTTVKWARKIGMPPHTVYNRLFKNKVPFDLVLYPGALPKGNGAYGVVRLITDAGMFNRTVECIKNHVRCEHYFRCQDERIELEDAWQRPSENCYTPEPLRAYLRAYNPTIPASVQAS